MQIVYKLWEAAGKTGQCRAGGSRNACADEPVKDIVPSTAAMAQ